jgi:hypothetical protein
MTNYESLKKMEILDMAKLLTKLACEHCICYDGINDDCIINTETCLDKILLWLNTEVEL